MTLSTTYSNLLPGISSFGDHDAPQINPPYFFRVDERIDQWKTFVDQRHVSAKLTVMVDMHCMPASRLPIEFKRHWMPPEFVKVRCFVLSDSSA